MSTATQERKLPSDSEIREYFLLLKEDPRSRVFAPLALALLARGRNDDAIKICEHGLRYHPEFSDGHLAQARVLSAVFRHQEAMQAIKRALALDARNIDAYLLAAQTYLTCGQPKAATDACMRVLDLDPEHEQALALLRQTSAGPASGQDCGATPAPAPAPQQFRKTAGTAPSRRQGAPVVANPFDQLLDQLESEATGRIEGEPQPFTALSAGSQSGIGPADEDEHFEVPTVKSKRPRVGVPRLPERPSTPAEALAAKDAPNETAPREAKADLGQDLLAQVPVAPTAKATGSTLPERPPTPVPAPGPTSAPPAAPADTAPPAPMPAPVPAPAVAPPVAPTPAPGSAPADSTLAEVAQIQAIIDAYADRQPREPDPDGPPLRVPRLGAVLSLFLPLLFMTGVVLLIVYLAPRQAKPGPTAPDQKVDAGPASRSQPRDPATAKGSRQPGPQVEDPQPPPGQPGPQAAPAGDAAAGDAAAGDAAAEDAAAEDAAAEDAAAGDAADAAAPDRPAGQDPAIDLKEPAATAPAPAAIEKKAPKKKRPKRRRTRRSERRRRR